MEISVCFVPKGNKVHASPMTGKPTTALTLKSKNFSSTRNGRSLNFKFGIPLVSQRITSDFCSIDIRLMSVCCPFIDRTTIGQQSDNNRTTNGQQTDNNQRNPMANPELRRRKGDITSEAKLGILEMLHFAPFYTFFLQRISNLRF